MRTSAATVILVVLGTGGMLFTVTHLGAYPEILGNGAFQALQTFVAVNTVAFATLGAFKLGRRPPKKTAHSKTPHSHVVATGS